MASVRITTKGLLCVVAAALALLYISFRGRLLLSELQDLLYGCHTDSFWPEKDPSHPSKYGGSGGHRWDIFWNYHDDVIKWKHFPRHWPFVRGIHRWPVNSPQKGRWRGALMFSMIYAWRNSWVNNRDAGDLRRHRAHYDVNVVILQLLTPEATTK